MGPNWYDRAVDELEADLSDGAISQAEFNAAIRDLNAELRGTAEEAAHAAYNDVMGGW